MYPSVLNTPKDITEVFVDNYVRTEYLLVVAFYIAILAIERFYQCLPHNHPLLASSSQLNDMIIKSPPNKRTTLEKFQFCTRIIIMLNILKKKKKIAFKNEIDGTLKKKMILTLILWLVCSGLVFFFFPVVGSQDNKSDNLISGISKVLCNDYYLEKEIKFTITECHTIWNNKSILTFYYLLHILYLYFSALQIRHGYELMRENIINNDWKSSISYTKFKIYENLPFLREINTTIEFVAANTSLTFSEWFKLEDIRGAMMQAKYQAERRQDKVVGDAIRGFVKIVIGFSAVVIVVLIIVSPLLLFSDLNPSSTVDSIVKADLDIQIVFEKYGNFTLLEDLHMIASKEALNAKQRLQFNNIIETTVPFSPEAIRSLSDLLTKSNNDTKSAMYVRIDIEIKTQLQEKLLNWTNNDKAKLPKSEYNLLENPGMSTVLRNSLSKKCDKPGLMSLVYLGSIYSVVPADQRCSQSKTTSSPSTRRADASR